MTSTEPGAQREPITDRETVVREALAAWEGPLLRYAGRMLPDQHSASDVVQDTFLELWRADQADIATRLTPWLFRVCRNKALDRIRRSKTEQRMKTMHPPRTADRMANDPPSTIGDGRSTAALDALEKLPTRQRDVLRLKFAAGLKYREIADVLELTESHVGVLIHTALRALRDQLAAVPSTAEEAR